MKKNRNQSSLCARNVLIGEVCYLLSGGRTRFGRKRSKSLKTTTCLAVFAWHVRLYAYHRYGGGVPPVRQRFSSSASVIVVRSQTSAGPKYWIAPG